MQTSKVEQASSFLENLSIQVKAFAASAVLLVCLILLGAVAYVTLDKSQEGLRTLSKTTLPSQQAFALVKDDIAAVQMRTFRYVSWASNSVKESVLTALSRQIDLDLQAIGKQIGALRALNGLSPTQQAALKSLGGKWKAYESSVKDMLEIGSSDAPMATMMLGQADDRFVVLASDFQKLSDSLANHANESSNALFKDAEQKKIILAIGAAAGLLLSMLISVVVSRSIVRPIKSVTNSMQQLSAGNTDVTVGFDGRRDEIGQMVDSIKVFRQNAIEMRAMELENLEMEKRNARETAAARARLTDAIESISEGFSLFDADDKLAVYNSKYKTLHSTASELVEPGTSFEAIIRAAYDRNENRAQLGNFDQWLARRLALHQNPASPHMQHRTDGRFIQISERKTTEGGIVATYTDITELKEREAELARLVQELQATTSSLTASLAQQTATSEVLRVISSSPNDAHPVFDMIAQRAMQVCEGQFCAVFRFDGELIHLVANHGMSDEGARVYEQNFPVRPGRINAIGRAIQTCAVAEIPDVMADADYGSAAVARAVTFRAIVAVPMMLEGRPIGGIAVSRASTGTFPEKHVDQLRTFADQAVIAIENVRMFQELESRTEELTLSGEQLAAVHAQVTSLNAQLQTENQRMGSELDVTRRLQLMLLPTPDELQSVEGLEIAGHMQPALEVGGDYYDVLQHGGRVKIGIGDVTGHGLESGVLMVMTQAIVRALLTSGETDHVRFFATLNHALFGNVQRMGGDKNLTLCLLDYAAGEVKISGQHEELLVVRSGGAVERVNTINLGFPVGLVDDIAAFVGQATITLQAGDGMVLYTDGITEAENMAGQQYGLERLCALVSRHWSGPVAAIKDAVVADVAQYIGAQTVYDDITLVVLKQK